MILTYDFVCFVCTDFPPGIHLDKPNITLPLARAEAETVMYATKSSAFVNRAACSKIY